MNKVQDYVVITSSKGIENLESLVKENILLGWQPMGGVAVMDSTGKQVLIQAMVRYGD